VSWLGTWAMLNSRDSRGIGYVLAIVGVGGALVVLIVGASIIASLGHEVPKELWAIGGALGGALVGILAPSPRSARSSNSTAKQTLAAQRALQQTNIAAENAVEKARIAQVKSTHTAENAARSVEEAIKAATQELDERESAAPAQPGSKAEGAMQIASALKDLLGDTGNGHQPEPTTNAKFETLARSGRSVLEAAVEAAEKVAAEQDHEATDSHAPCLGAQAAADRATTMAHERLDQLRGLSSRVVQAAIDAQREVTDIGSEVWKQLEDPTRDGHRSNGIPTTAEQDNQAGSRGALDVLTAQKVKLATVEDSLAARASEQHDTPADESDAVLGVHRAAVASAEAVVDEPSEPGDVDWKSNLRVLTEPKILVPFALFAITVGFALMLGLGVLGGDATCEATKQFPEKSACGYYATFGSQAANVLMSLAAAAAGALIGIFAAHPGENGKPGQAKNGS
jgi:hypothetical protein